MTIWTNDPPADAGFKSYKLLRCPPGKSLRCIVLSRFPIGCDLHFWKGRSTPCKHGDCEACHGGNRPRWKGYVFVKSLQTNSVAIMEYTARAHEAITAFLTTYPNLRGAKMGITRTGNRQNSPILITFDEGRSDEVLLPDPEDLQGTLERMWEIVQQPLPFNVEEPNRFATMINGRKP